MEEQEHIACTTTREGMHSKSCNGTHRVMMSAYCAQQYQQASILVWWFVATQQIYIAFDLRALAGGS
jgi:hypothetical protein